MGSELRRMIRDGAPPDWSPLMRLVAIEIADDARDPDRNSGGADGKPPWSVLPIEGRWVKGRWRDGLTERTGATASGIRHTLMKLARAGYEMRQQIGKDKRGRPVYAAKGHAVRFQVPPLPPRPEPQRWHESATFNGRKGGTSEIKGGTDSPQRWHGGATPSPHSPLIVPSSVVHPLTEAEVEGSPPAPNQDHQRDEDQAQYLNGQEAKRQLAARQAAQAREDRLRLLFTPRAALTGTDG
jgi:hypothetical protein